MIEVIGVIRVGANFGREELGIEWNFFDATVAVQPAEVGKGERCGLLVGILLGERIFRFAGRRSVHARALLRYRVGWCHGSIGWRLRWTVLQLLFQLIDSLLHRLQLFGDGGRNGRIGSC